MMLQSATVADAIVTIASKKESKFEYSYLVVKYLLVSIENFSLVSGLRLNNRKTEALWIGTYKDRDDKL